ncbi:MAG: GNAT family N-acetyltransferase [Candidatus Sericytochromatia bacterium]|nr:GNAT family N-acetyltransferase [Candidatus Sericytochromatia bacterium]
MIQIREPLADDQAFLHHGFMETAWEDRTQVVTPDVAPAESLYTVVHQDPKTRILVAADKRDRVIGYVAATEKRFLTKPRPMAFIMEAFVEPEVRGRGIGQQLLTAIEAWAVEGGYRQLGVMLNSRHRARVLFERLGFTIDRFVMNKGVSRHDEPLETTYQLRPPTEVDTAHILAAKAEIAWSGLSDEERVSTDRTAFLARVAPSEPPLWRHPKYWADVATDADGEFAGYSLWVEVPSPLHMGPLLCLYELYVKPEHRGKGLGTVLLKQGERRARDEGYGMLSLMVSVRNPALRLYESYGFTVDRLLMMKILPGN